MQPTNQNAFNILIVDDDDEIRSGLSKLLIMSGYKVSTAANGLLGIQLFDEGRFDLVITDILMPAGDGLTLILELKRLDEDVKIIAISGGGRKHNMGYLEIAKTFGAVQTLMKPVSSEKLLEAVQKSLGTVVTP